MARKRKTDTKGQMLLSFDGSDKKKKLTAELETIVSDRFDLIVKRKQIAYETMSKRLEELKRQVRESEDKIDSWKKLKSEKVKERLEGLTSETEKFSWR